MSKLWVAKELDGKGLRCGESEEEPVPNEDSEFKTWASLCAFVEHGFRQFLPPNLEIKPGELWERTEIDSEIYQGHSDSKYDFTVGVYSHSDIDSQHHYRWRRVRALAEEKEQKENPQPNCHGNPDPDWKWCPYCGEKL